MESDIVSGQHSAWVLLKKLGEGDAGEVYLVESLLEQRAAILKRPIRSAFASDVIRQTSQITSEAKILKALSSAFKMDEDFTISVPELLDLSKPGTAFSDRMFIVIEKAHGFDLALLARIAHLGMVSDAESEAGSPEEKRFLATIAESGAVPERIVLAAINALLSVFERIHQRAFDIEGLEAHGILWNDVKPEHIYWDPWRSQITVIDWGNGQFLQQDGATRDRQFSAADDYRQLVESFGRFLETYSPGLLHRLNWPERGVPSALTPAVVQVLQEQVWQMLQEQIFQLDEARQQETDLLRRGAADGAENPLEDLVAVHRRIIGMGDLPDYTAARNLALSHAARCAAADYLHEVEEICSWVRELPGSDSQHLALVTRLARITTRADAYGATEEQHICMNEAIQAALRLDWSTVLWNLVSALQNGPEPEWWYDLVAQVRGQQLKLSEDDLQPMLVTRRALLTLQSIAERMERSQAEINHGSLARLQDLVRRMREEVIPNWASIDPGPPYGDMTYAEIEDMLEEIGAFLPDARQALERALSQPRVQIQAVLAAWERGEFAAAEEGLRQVLLRDPDRKRLLRAEQALRRTPAWLQKVQRGPQPGEHYQAFINDIEYEGRELRNQIGPAGWIDLILEGCRQLRRGAWPPDLFRSLPLLVREMPWLTRFERNERLPAEAREDDPDTTPTFAMLTGTIRGKMGPDSDLLIVSPLDSWIPEARGSSARVFDGQLRDANRAVYPAAVKLMRMDKIDYALPLFREEVLVLNAMRGVPGVTPLWECGFLRLETEAGSASKPLEGSSLDRALIGAPGSLIRIGPGTGHEFINQIENRITEGWTPYLAFEQRDASDNLLALCDAGMTGGQYRPVADLLLICIQICEILQEAHQRNIVYRDHKILHYYWLDSTHGVHMIDWNVARLHPEGLSEYEKQMDMVQFGARALHHILTGRTAPGALPLGPTRPDEIEQAAKSYQAQWTYDDQRLPDDLRQILERVLAGSYNNAVQLRDDLKQTFLNLPDV